jgi:predicted TIM-barrel fold metal-dependent hydrolase
MTSAVERELPTAARTHACDMPRRAFLSGAAAAAASTLLPAGSSVAQAPEQRAGQPWRIDVHRHIAPPGYVFDPVRARVNDRAPVAAQLADMDEAGTALSVVTIGVPDADLPDEAAARKYDRLGNEYGAKLAADYPGRFGFFASIPFPDIDGSLKEIEYALDTLKANGIFLRTNYQEKFLGDPIYTPIFEELHRRRAVLYTHPDKHPCCIRLVPGLRDPDIEYGTNTTRAIAKMVFSGASRKYSNMRVIWSHAGGTMPFLVRRFIKRVVESPEFQPILPDGFLVEAQKFYYEIAQAPDAPSTASLKAVVPVSQILFGTDWPYLTTEEHVQGLEKSGVFTQSELAAIGRDNALKLMPELHPA